MSAFKLRLYQETALADLWRYFVDEQGHPLVVIPTGGGKSLTMAEWIRLMFEVDPAARVLIVTHVRELVAQNYAEIMSHWPDAPAGIYSAGLNRREIAARILFASIQSVHRRAFDLQQVDMVLIDEAHLIPRKSQTMYRRFLDDLRQINPHLKIVGFTATPFRVDSGMLHEGDDAVFTTIAHETSVRSLIDEGYLAPPVTFRQRAQIDTSGVGTRAGEFIAEQLEHAALDPATINAIADRIVEAGEGRRGWLIFGCTVKHCQVLRDALVSRGIGVETIFGDTAAQDRARIIAEFKAGHIRALCSMGVLTTGFNAKHVDLIALARPTKSTGLYVQMVGRGTRPLYAAGADLDTVEGRLAGIAAGPKPNCLVLDFGGNIARHGPFDDPFIKRPKKGSGDAPFKYCPECDCACATAVRLCPSCGHEFPPPERLVKIAPDAKPILAPDPAWVEVADVSYSLHQKFGSDASTSPPTLRVIYRCGLITHSEWVCFSHTGYPRTKAEAWWLRRAGAPVPRNTAEAYERAAELAVPSSIKIRQNGRFTEIAGVTFGTPVAGLVAA